ncbi:M28 family peptidase [Streptomyces sp. NPDC093594]|uniref:M28 family metallopeptidase n=1 Tax=Streptomyces sp. NPDC093594 TaxID=3155305 RepID=UPI00344B6286
MSTTGLAGPGRKAGPAPHDGPAGRMLAIVHRLAADDFTGRRVGTPGGRAAANWLVSHLQSLGAVTTTEEFQVHGAVREICQTPAMFWHHHGRTWRLTHRREFAEHLACAAAPASVSGELAHMGTDQVQGRWLLATAFSPAQFAEAARRGARGILLPRGTDEAGWMPKTITGPAVAALPVISVRTDLYQAMTDAAGDEATVTASMPLRTVDTSGVNIHAVFRSPSPGCPSVLLTAHYDGVGDDPELRHPAAADNASGVAAIIEAAHQLATASDPGIGIAVALLDAEEAGAHGSAHHAPRLPAGTLVINLDGAANLDEAAVVEAAGPARTLLEALDQAGLLTGVPLRAGPMPSDNRRYGAAGHAAIGIGMGLPGYQTPAETPDRVNADTLLAAVGLITATVANLNSITTEH